MLQSIRDNSQGIVAKIIVGLIAVTFALFGVESLVSLTSGSNAPATVNGVEISQQELYQGVQLQRRQMLSQMGENADPALLDENLISNMVLEGLIEQSVLVQSAENQELTFSDAMVDQLILSSAEFQQDGKFDRATFEAVLRNAGLTPLSYRSLIRKEKVTEQERIAYLLSAFTLPSEIKEIAQLDGQTRDIRYFSLSAEPVRASIVVSEDQIAEYYESNQSRFMTEEQVAIEYLLLDRDVLAEKLEVTDEEIESAYQQLVDTFQADEQRHAAHILIDISEDQNDAEAFAKIEKIAERVVSGESFEELARTESADPASAELGGDLGVNEKGVFSPEFEEALYALEKGEVSAPVRTEFGYHLIKLLDVVETEVPTFEQAQMGLRKDILSQKSEEEYVGALERLADISFSSGDLVEPAEALDLTIQKAGPFSRSGNEDDITSNPKVLAVAFDPELVKEGLNSTPVELDSGRSVVLRVSEHKLPREKTFDEVAEQITQLLIDQNVEAELNLQAEKVISQLKQGEALESLAPSDSISVEQGITRSQENLPQALRLAVFKMPKPVEGSSSYSAVDMLDGSKVIVALDAVETQEVQLQGDELRFMGMMLSNRKGQQDYQDHVNRLKEKAEIEKL